MRARSVSWLPASPHISSTTSAGGSWRRGQLLRDLPTTRRATVVPRTVARREEVALPVTVARPHRLYTDFPGHTLFTHSHLAAERFGCPP